MSEKEFNTEDFDLASWINRRRNNKNKEKSVEEEPFYEETEFEDMDFAKEGTAISEKRMRITMLGISGSGKTSFLSGVYQTMMANSFHGLSMISSSNIDEAFDKIGQIAEIALVNRENYDFAGGTDEPTVFPLTLKYDGDSICQFDFTDPNGGDVERILNLNDGMTEGARVLKNQLLQSDAILIFADAHELIEGSNKIEWQKKTGAFIINPILNGLIEAMGNRKLSIVLCLTKIDDERIPRYMKENDCAELVNRMTQGFNMIVERAQRSFAQGWNFGVVPVSAVGEGNYRLESVKGKDGTILKRPVVREGHTPVPYNIEAAIMYTIACILSQWEQDMAEEKKVLMDRIVEESPTNRLLAGIVKKIKGKENVVDELPGLYEKLEEKEKEISKINADIMKLIMETDILDKIQMRKDHLPNRGW